MFLKYEIKMIIPSPDCNKMIIPGSQISVTTNEFEISTVLHVDIIR